MAKKNHEKQGALVAQENPYYGYWEGIYLAFFNLRFYIDVIKRRRGIGGKHLALVLLIFSIPLAAKIAWRFNHFLAQEIIFPFTLLPPLEIKDGKVLLDKPMPYLLKNKANEVVTIIDTSGKVKSLQDKHYPHLSVLITKDELMYRVPSFHAFLTPGLKQTYDPATTKKFPSHTNEVFDASAFIHALHLDRLQLLADVMIYFTAFSIFFIFYLGFFIVFGVLAQFIAKLMLRANLSYLQTCRLLLVSSTPSIVLFLLALTFDLQFDGIGMILLAITAVYFCLGGIAYRRDTSQLARR